MKTIFIHGLGQNSESWNEVIQNLELDKSSVECVDLIKIQKSENLSYENLYDNVKEICSNNNEQVNLIGASLGVYWP